MKLEVAINTISRSEKNTQIPFNVPLAIGKTYSYLREVIKSGRCCGDGPFTKKCNAWLENTTGTFKGLLTTSCTHALEMAAILADIGPGDEVIMPSFAFVSTANPFVLRGAKIIFIDIRPDTMNIDETRIEEAVTRKTKAVVPLHYGGVGCAMDTIMAIAEKYSLIVIEDAAQGITAEYRDKPLGAIGHFGCYSFHETKNIQCGEGGAILINDKRYISRSEVIREKGTDRAQFLRGAVDKYTWVDLGSSYLPSEFNAAILYAQLELAHRVCQKRMVLWERYRNNLTDLSRSGQIELPQVPEECRHNAHLFYIKLRDIEQRQSLMHYLGAHGIQAVFHYIPLHSAKAGLKYGEFRGRDTYTTKESARLLRLPMFYTLQENEVDRICGTVADFFSNS